MRSMLFFSSTDERQERKSSKRRGQSPLWMPMITERQKWATGLTVAVLIYGAVVLFAYIVGWVSPRTCEGLSSVPCLVVAGWYAWMAGSRQGSLLHKWAWALFALGWFLVGIAFLLPSGTGRLLVLSSAAPTLLVGFGTTLLVNWYGHEEGGTNL